MLGVKKCSLFVRGEHKVVSAHAVKAYRGRKGVAPHILNLGIRWRWVVKITPLPLCTQEITSTHWIRCWLGPRSGLDDLEEREITYGCWNFKTQIVHPVV